MLFVPNCFLYGPSIALMVTYHVIIKSVVLHNRHLGFLDFSITEENRPN